MCEVSIIARRYCIADPPESVLWNSTREIGDFFLKNTIRAEMSAKSDSQDNSNAPSASRGDPTAEPIPPSDAPHDVTPERSVSPLELDRSNGSPVKGMGNSEKRRTLSSTIRTLHETTERVAN